MGLSEAFILETGSCEFGQKKMKEGASGPVPQGPGSSGLEIRLGASPAPAPQNWGIREWGCAQDGARSLGSEEAGLLRAGALAGPRFPHPYEPGGTGSPGPKQDEAWGLTRSAARAPGVGACLSVCGFAGRCHVRPPSGASRGAGAGVLGSQPTGAEPGSRRGRESGAARGPEPGSSVGSSLARACPAGLPLPEEGAVCRRGSRGLGTSPRGRAWGCPLRGPGGGAVLTSLPAPTPPAFCGYSGLRGHTLGLD